MRIGFDAKRLFNNFTGLGNYSRSLVSGLYQFYSNNDYYLFTTKIKQKQETQVFLKSPYQLIQPKKGSKNWWRTKSCTKDIIKNNIQIYHGLSHELPLGIKKTGAKSVVTIHDLIYKTYPHDFSVIDRNIYDRKFKYACKVADKVVAVSESTKKDLIELYQLNPDKVDVCYQTCNDMFKHEIAENELNEIRNIYQLPNNFLLYVGSIIERKNLLSLVQAVKMLKPDDKIPLVVIGNGGNYLNKVKTFIAENKLENEVIFLNNLKYDHLPAIYQLAQIFIYPSQYEGFGIPIIESLWSKTPVITSNISSLPEAAGAGAFYCDPSNSASIHSGIVKILSDTAYATNLVQEGFSHIQKFSTEKTTKQLMNTYNALL